MLYFENSTFGVSMSWSCWVVNLAGRVKSQKMVPWTPLTVAELRSCSQYGGVSPRGSRSKTKNDNRVDK